MLILKKKSSLFRPDVRHYFVIGGDGLSADVDAKIEEENTAHKDILLLPMQDSFKGYDINESI